MPKNDINIRIGAKLDGLQRGIKKAQRSLNNFANFAENTGRNLTTRLSLPIIGVGAAAVSSFAKFERMELGLKAMAEEGENTADTLQRLQDIAKLPGISLEQAVNGANQLRTVGFEARQAEEILKGLSKAVTLSGKGPAELQSVVKQLVQMSAKGRILQEDLGVIQENVPSIGIAIQDAFGTNNIEAIRKSGISAQAFTGEIIKAISANDKFAKAQGGLSNEFDNFGQSVSLSLSTLGRSISESINLTGILQKLSDVIARLTEKYSNLSVSTQKFITLSAAILAAIGPVIFGVGALATVFAKLQVAYLFLLPAIQAIGGALAIFATATGAVVVAIGFFVAAIAVAYKGSKEFRAVISGIGAIIKKFALDAVRFLTLPFDVLNDLFHGDLEGAGKRVLGIFKNNGETAGEAFANSYNASIARSINKETGIRAKRQTGSRGRLGSTTQADLTEDTPSLDSVFANLSAAPTISLDGISKPIRKTSDEYAKLSRTLGDVITQERQLQQIRDGGLGDYVHTLGTITSLQAETTGLNNELSKSIFDVGASFKELPVFVSEYDTAIEGINQRTQAFGTTFDSLGAKISATRSAIDTAFADGFPAASENIKLLVEELQKLSQIETIVSGIDALGSSIESLAEQGALSFQSFARAALSAISDVIGALIKQGVANAIAKNLGAAPGPVGLALAAFAGVAASSLFKGAINKITAPKLKDGGIIPPGFSGDRFPAFLNSGEAVIPLDRLFKELNGGGGGGQFILRGSDLLLATDRARVNSSRISGI